MRLFVLPGRVQVEGGAPGHLNAPAREVVVKSGEEVEVVLDLRVAGRVSVSLREDGHPVKGLAAFAGLVYRSPRGQSTRRLRTVDGAAVLDGVSDLTYTLEIDPIEGYVTPTPRVVEVKEGETTEVVIDLVRKR